MAYCTTADVKLDQGVTGSTDDTLIARYVAEAQQRIDTHCHRTFEASEDSTRYFDAVCDVVGRDLILDGDICAITTVTNGDSVVVASDEYVTNPRNKAPYYKLTILASKSKVWTYTSDPENAISILGRWAFSTTAPADIKTACIRLAAWMYRSKDSQVFDVTAIPDAGVLTVPKGIPADVKLTLEPYVRRS